MSVCVCVCVCVCECVCEVMRSCESSSHTTRHTHNHTHKKALLNPHHSCPSKTGFLPLAAVRCSSLTIWLVQCHSTQWKVQSCSGFERNQFKPLNLVQPASSLKGTQNLPRTTNESKWVRDPLHLHSSIPWFLLIGRQIHNAIGASISHASGTSETNTKVKTPTASAKFAWNLPPTPPPPHV